MRKDFLFIMFLIWMGFLAGCRASKESKARNERTAESEIGVELRKADSLWSSIAERLTMKIEFYPQLGDFGTSGHGTEGPQTIIQKSLGNGTSLPAAPLWPVPAGVAKPLPWQAQGVGAGGTGAVNPPDPLCKGGKPKDGMYSKKRCFNIVCIPSGEIRTVDIDAIVEFNGEEVFI